MEIAESAPVCFIAIKKLHLACIMTSFFPLSTHFLLHTKKEKKYGSKTFFMTCQSKNRPHFAPNQPTKQFSPNFLLSKNFSFFRFREKELKAREKLEGGELCPIWCHLSINSIFFVTIAGKEGCVRVWNCRFYSLFGGRGRKWGMKILECNEFYFLLVLLLDKVYPRLPKLHLGKLSPATGLGMESVLVLVSVWGKKPCFFSLSLCLLQKAQLSTKVPDKVEDLQKKKKKIK